MRAAPIAASPRMRARPCGEFVGEWSVCCGCRVSWPLGGRHAGDCEAAVGWSCRGWPSRPLEGWLVWEWGLGGELVYGRSARWWVAGVGARGVLWSPVAGGLDRRDRLAEPSAWWSTRSSAVLCRPLGGRLADRVPVGLVIAVDCLLLPGCVGWISGVCRPFGGRDADCWSRDVARLGGCGLVWWSLGGGTLVSRLLVTAVDRYC